MEKIEVDNEVTRLRILKTAHEGKQFALQDAFTFQYPKKIQWLEKQLQLLKKDLERRNQAMGKEPEFAITLQGQLYQGHKEAGEILRAILDNVTAFTEHEIGTYKGFPLFVKKDMTEQMVIVRGESDYVVELKNSDSGNMVRLENRVNALDDTVEDIQRKICSCETEIKNAKLEYEKPFPYEMLLREKISRQMEIDAELEIKDQEENREVEEKSQKLPCQAIEAR